MNERPAATQGAEGRERAGTGALEVAAVLAAVGSRATTASGRRRIQRLRPVLDPDAVGEELLRVEATRALLEFPDWAGVPQVDGLDEPLQRLEVPGTVLDGPALLRVGRLLEGGRVLRPVLARAGSGLGTIAERVFTDPDLERVLERTLDLDGRVQDRASPALARLRQAISRASADLVRALERFADTLPDAHRVPDASVSVRDGRYVVPIRREGKSAVGGIVHGQSASGATLFVEPPAQVERMNALRELELDEEREVQRILAELTDRLRPNRSELRAAVDAIVDLDTLVARARTANDWNAAAPAVGPLWSDAGARMVVRGARHPLLLERGVDVVPFDLDLDRTERVLVVSGPNTGGKTVFLKSIGVLPLLAQLGVVPPVAPGTTLPLFDAVFADIGDAQSIDDDLSTFSGHIAGVRRILAGATSASLVLLDELGTGTDPTEGAALGMATLEALADRGCLTVATSHLGALKRLEGEVVGVVNGSLEFDAERVEPTYQFRKGRPGRSYGIQIARRLELPQDVIDSALERMDGAELDVDRLLARLEADEKRSRELVARLERERDEARRLLKDAQERAQAAEQREREAERTAAEEARKILLEARRDVEDAIQAGRDAAGEEEAVRAARRSVEEAASRARTRAESAERAQAEAQPRGPQAGRPLDDGIREGTHVRLEGGARGVVAEIDGKRAQVELDTGLRLQVRLDALRAVDPPDANARRGTTEWTAVGNTASVEVDLRGLRVDEVQARLLPELDRAVLADLPSLRIIHGMGTGAVRARVVELVDADPRVDSHRPGVGGEGGRGVTVVTFR